MTSTIPQQSEQLMGECATLPQVPVKPGLSPAVLIEKRSPGAGPAGQLHADGRPIEVLLFIPSFLQMR